MPKLLINNKSISPKKHKKFVKLSILFLKPRIIPLYLSFIKYYAKISYNNKKDVLIEAIIDNI